MYTIYGKNGCSACEKAKALLKNKGLNFEYLIFGADYTLGNFLIIGEGQRSFPLITLGTKDGVDKIGTYDDLVKHLELKYA